jgi:UDP-sugar transporter A1/2/3
MVLSAKEAKSASLLAGVFQQSALVLVIRYSKMRHQDPYLTSVAVWSAECIKMLLSITLEYSTVNGHGNENENGVAKAKRSLEEEDEDSSANPKRSWFAVLKDMFSMRPTSESFKLIIPAFLYVVQNNLLFFALSNLSVPTYQVTNQGKLLTTAIVSRILLKKRISTMQYLSLVLLAGGVALVNLSESRTSSTSTNTMASSQDQQNHILGLLAVIASCVTSGICGVYFELIVKTTAHISIHKRNFQLAFWSFLLAAGTIICSDMPKVKEDGLFQGFDGVVLVVIICQALTGLVVSLMLKYADAILKGFATSAAVVVATAASIFLFDAEVSFLFFLGVCMVGSAGKMYSYYPHEAGSSLKISETIALTEQSSSNNV